MAGLDHLERGPCRRKECGHVEERHWHLRHGEDCGTCGRKVCPRYLPPRRAWMAKLLHPAGH